MIDRGLALCFQSEALYRHMRVADDMAPARASPLRLGRGAYLSSPLSCCSPSHTTRA